MNVADLMIVVLPATETLASADHLMIGALSSVLPVMAIQANEDVHMIVVL